LHRLRAKESNDKFQKKWSRIWDVQVSVQKDSFGDTTGDAQGFAARNIIAKTFKMTAYSVFWQIFVARPALERETGKETRTLK
jgi:hypothetical protein